MDYHTAALNLHKKDLKEQQRINHRITAAYQEIDRLLNLFLEIDSALQKVILFGSLARGTVKSANFDIDLAVTCSADKFFGLVGAALESDFSVDVVDLASVSRTLGRFIEQEGVVLYEKCGDAQNIEG